MDYKQDFLERYADFSEDPEIVDGFRHGSLSAPWVEAMSTELQSALSRKNPVASLRQLVAFGIAFEGHLFEGHGALLKRITVLLGVNALLLAWIVFKL